MIIYKENCDKVDYGLYNEKHNSIYNGAYDGVNNRIESKNHKIIYIID